LPGLKLALLLGILLVATVESPAAGAAIGSANSSERPVLALDYVRGSEVPECMGESELRGRLRAQLGYDPFSTVGAPGQRETLRIEIGRRRGVLVADLALIGNDGVLLAQQRLRSGESNCASLGAALEVAVSVMFDRAEEPKKAPPPTEAELLALSPTPFPEITLPATPPPPKPPIHLWAGVLVAWAADLRP